MAYQFIHIEAYSRHAGAGKAGSRTMGEVLSEADRKYGSCPHINSDKLADPNLRPERLYGLKLEAVEKEAIEWAEQAKDAKGRKLRKDGHCLLAGVISLPRGTSSNDWKRFKSDAIKWLKKEYGSALRSVIEHKDEEHPHVHFYVVPEQGKPFHSLHIGQKAARDAKAKGLKKGEQNAAYINAMRGWQDKFNQEVGQKHGLTRLGPARRRLTRAEWKNEQAQAKALKEAQAKTKKILEYAEKKKKDEEEKSKKYFGIGTSIGGLFQGMFHFNNEVENELIKKLEDEIQKISNEKQEIIKKFEKKLEESEEARKLIKEKLKTQDLILENYYKKYGRDIKENEFKDEKSTVNNITLNKDLIIKKNPKL